MWAPYEQSDTTEDRPRPEWLLAKEMKGNEGLSVRKPFANTDRGDHSGQLIASS